MPFASHGLRSSRWRPREVGDPHPSLMMANTLDWFADAESSADEDCDNEVYFTTKDYERLHPVASAELPQAVIDIIFRGAWPRGFTPDSSRPDDGCFTSLAGEFASREPDEEGSETRAAQQLRKRGGGPLEQSSEVRRPSSNLPIVRRSHGSRHSPSAAAHAPHTRISWHLRYQAVAPCTRPNPHTQGYVELTLLLTAPRVPLRRWASRGDPYNRANIAISSSAEGHLPTDFTHAIPPCIRLVGWGVGLPSDAFGAAHAEAAGVRGCRSSEWTWRAWHAPLASRNCANDAIRSSADRQLRTDFTHAIPPCIRLDGWSVGLPSDAFGSDHAEAAGVRGCRSSEWT